MRGEGEWLWEVSSLATGLSSAAVAAGSGTALRGARHLGGEVEGCGWLTGGKWCDLIGR